MGAPLDRMNATYVYCVVSAPRRPRVPAAARRLPHSSAVRVLDVDRHLYLVVTDVPTKEYGEAAINKRLSDLEWVSRAAVAHEAVVESFGEADAVLPMKLFTIFTNDRRAVEQVRGDRRGISSVMRRVARQQEFGIRVVLDRAAAVRRRAASRRTGARTNRNATGAGYLARKKAERDAAVELAEHARETVAAVYDRLASRSRQAKRRSATELPTDGPLLLDAAFLVPRATARAFRAQAAREARALAKDGYGLTLTGPWPPY
ncbi:MAG: hypothetical protein DMG01_22595, partial [Acidobacteria bacterium]